MTPVCMILRALTTEATDHYIDRKWHTDGNSGFDLLVLEPTICKPKSVTYVTFDIQAMTSNGSGFFLLPRSSLSKTPLRLANSVGLIDPNYRGNIIAALENTSDEEFTLARTSRPVQLALPSLMPFDVIWSTQELPATERGDGGFGSTGGTLR